MTRVGLFAVFTFALVASSSLAADAWQVLGGKRPDDARLAKQRVLGDEYHPWKPAETPGKDGEVGEPRQFRCDLDPL